jgi:hypothetical protein
MLIVLFFCGLLFQYGIKVKYIPIYMNKIHYITMVLIIVSGAIALYQKHKCPSLGKINYIVLICSFAWAFVVSVIDRIYK